jgi:hypothetical protein
MSELTMRNVMTGRGGSSVSFAALSLQALTRSELTRAMANRMMHLTLDAASSLLGHHRGIPRRYPSKT